MTFEEWKIQLDSLNAQVEEAEKVMDAIEEDRKRFFRATVGFAPGDVASVQGTVQMILRVNELFSAGK